MSEWDEADQYDWAAIQERLALLLYQMATKVIGEKIKVDPLGADSAIRYCLAGFRDTFSTAMILKSDHGRKTDYSSKSGIQGRKD